MDCIQEVENQLFIPIANLTSVQKGITYCGIKIYNSLPSSNLNLKNDSKQFKNELYRYLLNNLIYPVKNFWSSAQLTNFINYFCCNFYCIVLLLCYAQYLILETVLLIFVYFVLYCIVFFNKFHV
jgi:hypothetical protein